MATFYLSSTFQDLQECREKVSQTLRQMGHTVVSMEDYTADSRPPLKKVLADINGCDAYIGIFARRYGYVPKEGNPKKLSITELEYLEAVRLKKKLLIFILTKDASWPGDPDAESERARRQIKALRERLSQDHVVSFFTDCNDLATKVSVAASHFPKNQEPESVPSPAVPLAPTPRPWKWYAKLSTGAILAFFVLGLFAAVMVYRKGAVTSGEHFNQWAANFTNAEKLNDHWDYPPGMWSLEPGEGVDKDPDNRALLVKGQQMGIPNDLNGDFFRNFSASFKIRFKSGGTRAAWVLRAQPDRLGGYLFELVQEGANLTMYFWIYEDGRKKGNPLGKELVPFGDLRESKSLLIVVDVKDNRFDYEITFGENPPDPQGNAGFQVKPTFQDNPANVRWPQGTIGFLVTDDSSVMRVEYVYAVRKSD